MNDMLNNIWTSASFAATVAARYSSIKIKGYALTRTILCLDNHVANVLPFTPEVPFAQFVWRYDSEVAYGAVTTFTATQMLNQQDVKYGMMAINPGAIEPLVIEEKIFARPDQVYTLDTAVAPAVGQNIEYWDACFHMGIQIGLV